MPHDTQARHGRHTLRRRTRPADHGPSGAAVAPRRGIRRAAAGLIGTAAALALPVHAWAATAAAGTTTGSDLENTPLPAADGGNGGEVAAGMGGTLLRLGIGLIVVVGLILGVWHLMRRAQRGRMPGAGGPGAALVDVVSTTPLGPNRFLHLIRVGEELILVGATEHSVTPVARIGGEEAVEMLGSEVPASEAGAAFDIGGRQAPDPRVRAAANSRDASLIDRLRSLTARR